MVVSKMGLRILFGSLSQVCRQSLVFDVRVNMSRKKLRSLQANCCKLCSTGASQAKLDDSSVASSVDLSDGKSDSDQTVETTQEQNHKFLIVGLGNLDMPRTRHSIGTMFVNILAKQLGIRWTRDVFKTTGGFTAKAMFENVEISLLKPRVPMNLIGTSVNKSVRHFSVDPENTYLVHDELDKRVGEFQLKTEGGSANGHNGVKSVMNSLKNDKMPRIKIGIDRPTNQDVIAEYVLEDFSSKDLQAIRGVIDESAKSLMEHIGQKTGVNLVDQMGKYVDMFSDDNNEEYRGFRNKNKKNQYNRPRYDGNRRSRNHYDEDLDGFSQDNRRGNHFRRNDNRFQNDRSDRYQDNQRDFDSKFQDERINHRRSHLYDNDE